jgi:hypothetical protein
VPSAVSHNAAVPVSREPHPTADLTPSIPAGFVPYAGDGYALLLPGKWNPSKEREFAGMDVRCAAAVPRASLALSPLTGFLTAPHRSRLQVRGQLRRCQQPVRLRPPGGEVEDRGTTWLSYCLSPRALLTSDSRVLFQDYGSPDAFLQSTLVPYLGQQSWQGDTQSEGAWAGGGLISCTTSCISGPLPRVTSLHFSSKRLPNHRRPIDDRSSSILLALQAASSRARCQWPAC